MLLAREQRRLAAILFADAVGSSRLMGRDESGTVARLLEHLNQRLAPAATRRGGRVVRLKGDGSLVEFAIELRRFDEAVIAGKRAVRQNLSNPAAYRCLASALAHLERDAEAREAAGRLLELDPAFTISAWIARGGQSNAKPLIEGLRKAGLPE